MNTKQEAVFSIVMWVLGFSGLVLLATHANALGIGGAGNLTQITNTTTIHISNSNVTSASPQDIKEFDYCPAPNIGKWNYTIEGCPLVRVYVHQWSASSIIQQNQTLAIMAKTGFRAVN